MADAGSIHLQMFEAVKKRDFAQLRSLYHDDYVYMSGDGQEQKGADTGVAVAEGYTTAFPDLEFEFRNHYTPSATTSIIEFTARGTHKAELEGIPATGNRVEMVVCNVVETQDGKIHREREYFDTMAMMQQLGVDLGG